MTIITIDGNMGSGARDIGIELAKQLKFDYLDRWILAETAQRLGATVDALSQKELQTGNINEKLSKILKNLLERSALVGAGGDPSFGPGIEAILSRSDNSADSPITDVHDLDDKKFLEVLKQVIWEFAGIGNSIIVGRGGCSILENNPKAIHLLTVSLIEHRIPRIMERHNMDNDTALNYIIESDNGRAQFFKKYFNQDSEDSSIYDFVINTSKVSIDTAVKLTQEYLKIQSQ